MSAKMLSNGHTLEIEFNNRDEAIRYLRENYTGDPSLKMTVVHCRVKTRIEPVSFIYYPASGWFIL